MTFKETNVREAKVSNDLNERRFYRLFSVSVNRLLQQFWSAELLLPASVHENTPPLLAAIVIKYHNILRDSENCSSTYLFFVQVAIRIQL